MSVLNVGLLIVKGSRTCHPTYATWCIDHFKPKATGKQQMQAQAFSELSSSAKRQVLHKGLNVITPPQEFPQPERTDSSQEKRLEVHTTPIQTSSPTASHLSPCFLKIIYSAPFSLSY